MNEEETRRDILQVLLSARRKSPRDGGVSSKVLMDRLKLATNEALEGELSFLIAQRLIEECERVYLITVDGVDYLEKQLPPSDPPNDSPGSPQPPWTPGDPPGPWPPRGKGPYDPSRVPLRPKPSPDAGEIALPFPDQSKA